MITQRRLVNLAGTLLVIVALVAGTLLMALPVYLESLDIRNEKARVASSNEILVSQIEGLRAKEAQLPQLEADLAELRAELPPIPRLDDVIDLALRAADEADGAVTGVGFSDPADFVPRADSDLVESLPKSATEVNSSEDRDNGSTTNGDSAAGDPAAADPGAADAGKPVTVKGLQVSASITVVVPSTSAAARFLDALRAGQRLLRIDSTRATYDAKNGDVEVTVDGVVFVKAE